MKIWRIRVSGVLVILLSLAGLGASSSAETAVIQVRPVQGMTSSCHSLVSEPNARLAVTAKDLSGQCLRVAPATVSIVNPSARLFGLSHEPDRAILVHVAGRSLQQLNDTLLSYFHKRVAFLLNGRVLYAPIVAERFAAGGNVIVAIAPLRTAKEILRELKD
jgi:hypothetical protein